MKLRLTGTADECARVAFLLRFGPPELEVLQVDGPYPNRGDPGQVRAYLELRLARDPGPWPPPSTAWPTPRAARCWSTPGRTRPPRG
jgi:hypothetical protein